MNAENRVFNSFYEFYPANSGKKLIFMKTGSGQSIDLNRQTGKQMEVPVSLRRFFA
jgi:hypothetical protein